MIRMFLATLTFILDYYFELLICIRMIRGFSIDNAIGSQFVAIESGPGYNDGAWHQVIGTRHGATTSLYVDGVLTATGTGPHTVYLHNTVHMVAGESVCDGIDGTVPFTGEMGELMTYRSAITP